MNKDCFKIFPEFETERLKIRAFKEADFQSYIKWNHGDIPYYMNGLHYIKNEDIEGFKMLFLKNAPRMFMNKESIIWCIAEKILDNNIGKIEMCGFDFSSNNAQIHYCLAKNERHIGYMTEAVHTILGWAFNTLALHRMYTYVWEENKDSANILLKYGFKLEGVLREHNANKFTLNGDEIKDKAFFELKNECIYGLLKADYNGIV